MTDSGGWQGRDPLAKARPPVAWPFARTIGQKNKGVPAPENAKKPGIKTGKNAGKNPFGRLAVPLARRGRRLCDGLQAHVTRYPPALPEPEGLSTHVRATCSNVLPMR
ncbi:hypothetical protein LE181_07740 [Streptomyces sp. SCA3-4]|uniref:hypothetical protein n=1 Tax=Streptomyces sichuanensis TaxID=2871810 RepID=UPI001CE3A0BD|nr:hypothetical protein [Streptomyces sichuanensis]MCA6092054.1 hypothetical protein [Streptomyces sichuanensis]